jgi:dual specificity tyrosine-phosphorylation-regulated kinase 2/3/4
MVQYSETYTDGEPEELVPPVPAIPKAYESPKDFDHPPFFSSSLKSSQSVFSDVSLDGSTLPIPRFLPTPRTSLDVPAEAPRKRSGEQTRPVHMRASTLSNGTTAATLAGPAASARAQPDPNGRKNANLQPLRLPPLNLMPIIATRTLHSTTNHPRPSQEVDSRDDWMSFATPEPKRNQKTPSTPMTASKATFFSRRQEDTGKIRSSSSHYALRDVMGMDDNGNITKYWDDSGDFENNGVPIPGAKQRSAITPFASGSLPKGSGEYVRNGLRGRPSGEYGMSGGEDEYSLGGYENMLLQSSKPRTRAQTNTTMNSIKSGLSLETSVVSIDYMDSPTESIKKEPEKKESSGGGLRRKLSLGWKRSGSKAANHTDNKISPQQENRSSEEKQRSRLQKRHTGANEMPPPKLPASATWTGDVSSVSSAPRPSMDAVGGGQGFHARRKSQVPLSISNANPVGGGEQVQQQQQPPTTNGAGVGAGVRTRSQHTEQPTPVTSRASSWGNLGQSLRPGAKPAPPGTRHRPSASTISANTKDKDDLAADDDMTRLSRKRKDVDSAARESDELRKRALARSPVSAEHILHDRGLIGGSGLNVFERGEIIDYEQDGIYFTGTKSARKIIGSLTPSPQPSIGSDGKTSSAGGGNNYGYDDERGDYNIVLGDHLAYRFEVVDILGKGSFGQVVRCVDHKEGGVVAVKIIRNKKRFHQQALVEVGILGRLRDWVSTVRSLPEGQRIHANFCDSGS